LAFGGLALEAGEPNEKPFVAGFEEVEAGAGLAAPKLKDGAAGAAPKLNPVEDY
jgi:hypothetical protein